MRLQGYSMYKIWWLIIFISSEMCKSEMTETFRWWKGHRTEPNKFFTIWSLRKMIQFLKIWNLEKMIKSILGIFRKKVESISLRLERTRGISMWTMVTTSLPCASVRTARPHLRENCTKSALGAHRVGVSSRRGSRPSKTITTALMETHGEGWSVSSTKFIWIHVFKDQGLPHWQ